MMIRFHLDEHLSPSIAHALRCKGVDISTSQEASLLGQEDKNQFAFALAEKRVLVTCDDDFLQQQFRNAKHYGICFCYPKKYSLGEIIEAIFIVHQCGTEKEMRNHIEYL